MEEPILADFARDFVRNGRFGRFIGKRSSPSCNLERRNGGRLLAVDK
jgi:hypothetical protein